MEQIRELGVADFDLAGLPEAVVRRLARYAAGAKAQNIARMPEPRRTGTLAAFASSLLTTATDDVLDVFDLLMGELRVKAEANAKRKRLQTLRDYDRAAIDLRSVVTVVLDALDDPGLDVRTAILARATRDRLERAVETVARIARNPGDRYQTELLHRYATVRRYLPHFLRTLEFKGVPSARSTLDAVDFLRQAESQPYRHRFSAAEAPTEVIDRIWRTHVFEDDGTINRRAYTLAILGALRESLRRHDIFLESSFRWADPRAQLLSQVEWCDRRDEICAALGHELAPGVELAALADRLGRMFQLVGEGLEQNNSLAITASDGESSFSLSPLEAIDEPESLVALRLAVDSLMPRAELPEIILEVDAWTGFSLEFSHGSGAESRLEDLKASLCAVLVSQACNIGYRPLVRSNVAALTRERLNFVAANYVRTETLEAANARLVEHHAAQPLTELWGRGDIASVDGLRFVVPVQTINAGFNRRYFPARGVTWLNYMSDQFTGFYQLVVPGTLRDSLYILEGLLEHQTVLDPREVMSDSAGASEIIFALFWLLGYQFSPRLADVNDATFWRIDRNADYGSLNSLARKTVGTDRIAVHWDDLLRIAGSLQQGAVRAADLVRTLGSKAPTSTAKALRDLGRIIKTLFLLTYIDDVDYQQRIHAQLNRHESRHSLARALFHGERGQLRQKYREGQEDQLSALGLVVNIVVLWNTIYCQAALDRLRSAGSEVATADIARLSPLGHKHINFRGRYNVSHASTPAPGELRPLHGA